MNREQEPIVDRLRQADTRSVALLQTIDPAALATQISQRRQARSRRRAITTACIATIGIIVLVVSAGLLTRPVANNPRVAEVTSPSDAEYVARLDREYQARSMALQAEFDGLVRLEQENERMRQLLDEQQALDAQIQKLTQMSNRLREFELDSLRAELSQSVFENSSNPIIFGF